MRLSTEANLSCISFDSYIKPQLTLHLVCDLGGCISFDSYIKPQPYNKKYYKKSVVYLLIPTSNHNNKRFLKFRYTVVYLLIPTSNHNAGYALVSAYVLYIF